MEKKVKVSIILPSLNVAEYIDECMQSVISQTLQDIEIISVDAGSTDGTKEKLEKYAEEDARIKLITSTQKSYGKQVNMGIAEASGEYIGIVETDDYIALDMYEKLYYIAKSNQLDYIQANFDQFFSLENGEKVFTTIPAIVDDTCRYGDIVCQEKMQTLLTVNFTIWGGLYRKEFLTKADIWLNETPKAAYQDIGFWQQVIVNAERGMYYDGSFYRYRIDRDQSSVNSVNGLICSYNEHQKLLLESKIPKAHERRFYYSMIMSFELEIENLLPKVHYMLDNENQEAFDWFVGKAKEALCNNIISRSDFSEAAWNKMNLLLNSIETFSDYLKELANQVANWKNNPYTNYIIFGAGQRGISLLGQLDGKANIVALCDNNKGKYKEKIGDYPILPLEECMRQWDDAVYIITVRKCVEEIKQQLFKSGVLLEKIEVYKKA